MQGQSGPGSSAASFSESMAAIDAPRKRTVLGDLEEEEEPLIESEEDANDYGSVSQSGEFAVWPLDCSVLP